MKKDFRQKVYDFFTVKNSLLVIIGLLILILLFQNIHFSSHKDIRDFHSSRSSSSSSSQMRFPGMMGGGMR